MKTSLTYLKNHLVCFGAAVLLLVSVSAAKAQVLLTIDVSNPNAVTITTSTASTGTVVVGAQTSVNNGVDLLGFFTSNTGTFESSTVSAATLTSANLSSVMADFYDTAIVDDYSTTDVDLSLYSSTGNDDQVFTAGNAGFSGSLTVDMSGLSTFLPTAGSSGEIVAGYSNGHPGTVISNTPIGEWQVVGSAVSAPEPSTWALVLLGISTLTIYRVRMRKSCTRSWR